MLWLVLPLAATVTAIHQISPEKPKDLRLRLCSHERQPMQIETMLYFPEAVKFCASITTNKNVITLAKDRQRTTFLQPLVSTTIREIDGTGSCKINYMGYGGEYRLSPDLGYYKHCQRSISKYISMLVDNESKPKWNSTNSQCPIQDLPNTYKDYIACDLIPNRWYELEFRSSIRYEVFHKKTYRQFAANHSSTFLFKPDYTLDRNGTELDWLARLVEVKIRLTQCKKVRYLLRVDDHWNHQYYPLKVTVDYKITADGYTKKSRQVGNGTINHWFAGSFEFEPSPLREHELCAHISYDNKSSRSFVICKRIASRGHCSFVEKSRAVTLTFNTVFFLIAKAIIIVMFSF
uniref:Uncharacterized protein n=1 Tax=Panagrellus redivivus TaxID=6233 RepID=A0A7E4VTU8_PANRE